MFKDRRETATREKTPPIGKRRDFGANFSATLKFVSAKERSDVIEKLVSGRTPETKYYFYHGAFEDRHTFETNELIDYLRNANLDEAGNNAVQAAFDVLAREFAAGNLRKAYQ